MKITMIRLEGPTDGNAVHVETWAGAIRQLQDWSRTAPEGGAYDKVDLCISLGDDGFSMRFDLSRTNAHTVRDAAINHCRFYAGTWTPSHWSKARHLAYLDGCRWSATQELRDRWEALAVLLEPSN
ncbi:hypothetical protein [Sandaracinus amylolyticus]|uniref:hypothetical protein n=1 Tax=Sandaracinus amylolyticus TaxID=927083 RepID=UPI001F212970|nr:hypothetical protein [Sandaracinus amylolyticus]UJR78907.1 Hypothetical protein I5071_9400 [Sandaracinus amylolyticus]